MMNAVWSRNAVLYEMNLRQTTSEGTLAAAAERLGFLRDLGIDAVWLMPHYPIGKVGRKGSLGSYYSIRDYRAVNPEFGTMADFDAFVRRAHALGMKVLIDWVANHTSRDARWLAECPSDWYERDASGRPVVPDGWDDTAKLNYAYHNGGADVLMDEIQQTFGVPVDYYIHVDLKGFIALVDELGGVDIEIPLDMNYDDPVQGLHIHFSAGYQHLDGQETMEAVRYRHDNKSSPNYKANQWYTDVQRGEFQREVLITLAKKVISWNSLTKVTSFLDIFNSYVETNLSLTDMAYFAEQAAEEHDRRNQIEACHEAVLRAGAALADEVRTCVANLSERACQISKVKHLDWSFRRAERTGEHENEDDQCQPCADTDLFLVFRLFLFVCHEFIPPYPLSAVYSAVLAKSSFSVYAAHAASTLR